VSVACNDRRRYGGAAVLTQQVADDGCRERCGIGYGAWAMPEGGV